MDAKQRIEALADYAHCNIKSLSELCGYERPQAFYDIQRGRTRNISAAMCAKIIKALPDINRAWLMTGEGSMTIEVQEASQQPHMVPLLPLTALAGPIKAYYEGGVDVSKCQQIPSMAPGASMAIPISGDSMEPLFVSGSIIFIKRINEEAFIPWGHPMVLDTENGVFIKNVLPDESNQGYIWGDSVNPRYPRMHIPKTSIYGMYRVLSAMQPFVTM